MEAKVKIKMAEGCEDLIPVKAHVDDAGYDLKACHNEIIPVGEHRLVKTGLFIELPHGDGIIFEAQVRSRSGLALKHGIHVLNSPGTIDTQYRGEVGVVLANRGMEPFVVNRGDRIAQMVINFIPKTELVVSEGLSGTTRNAGGFGSTGK